MEIKIYTFDRVWSDPYHFTHNTIPTFRGTINLKANEFTRELAEKCWDICNWSCYTDVKPSELNSDVNWCDHGIVFEGNGNHFLALSNGWLKGTSTEITDYVRKNATEISWFE